MLLWCLARSAYIDGSCSIPNVPIYSIYFGILNVLLLHLRLLLMFPRPEEAFPSGHFPLRTAARYVHFPVFLILVIFLLINPTTFVQPLRSIFCDSLHGCKSVPNCSHRSILKSPVLILWTFAMHINYEELGLKKHQKCIPTRKETNEVLRILPRTANRPLYAGACRSKAPDRYSL